MIGRIRGSYSYVLAMLSSKVFVLFNKKKGLMLGGGGEEDCPHCNGTGKRSRHHSIQIPVADMSEFMEAWTQKPNWKYWHRKYLTDVVGMTKDMIDKEMNKMEEE